MSMVFQRRAKPLLVDGGYEFDHTNTSGHEVWRKTGVPDLHVPGSPSGGTDAMLARVRRAIRKGTPLTPPSGQETDMPARKAPDGPSLVDELVKLAPPALQRRVAAIERGDDKPAADPADITKWMRKCVDTHGSIPSTALTEAAEKLHMTTFMVSKGRRLAGMVSYRIKGSESKATLTDYAKRVDKLAGVVKVGAPGKKRGPYKKTLERSTKFDPADLPAPKDPDESGGRRLDMGGLTAEQHAEAEQRMKESTEKADRELAELRAAREQAEEVRAGIAPPATNGSAKRSDVDEAIELLRQAALAETHSLTESDIMLLRGHVDTMKRLRDDLEGMSASINLILGRVEARV